MKIFLSYSHDDEIIANAFQKLIEDVSERNIQVFRAADKRPRHGVAPGDLWRVRIVEKLREAKFVIALISERSRQSSWVNWEWGLAAYEKNKLRIPVRYEVEVEDLDAKFTEFQTYRGDEEADVQAIVQQLLSEADLKFGEVSVQAVSPAIASYLTTVAQFLSAHPFVEQLAKQIKKLKGDPHLTREGGLAVLHTGFARYTGFLTKMINNLEEEPDPACLIYNILQPNSYIDRWIGYLRDHHSAEKAEEKRNLIDNLHETSPDIREQLRFDIADDCRIVFPSIRVIAELMSKSENCARYSIVKSETTWQQIWFLDSLMGVSQRHFILLSNDAAYENEGHLHSSDFSLWSNKGISMITDYYDESATLIVYWALQTEKPPEYIRKLKGLLDALDTSALKVPIKDYVDRLNRAEQ
jgi:hypothetical protein